MYPRQIFVLVLSLFLGSCDLNQNHDLAPNLAKNDVQVSLVEGMLHFSSTDAFQKVTKQLITDNDVANWSKQFTGFISLKNHYDELVRNDIGSAIQTGKLKNYEFAYVVVKDKDGANDYVCAVRDISLATVLNKDGLVQIGDVVYKVNDTQIMKASPAFKDDLLKRNVSTNVQTQDVLTLSTLGKQSVNGRVSGEVDNYDDIYYTPWSGASERRFSVNWWAKQYCWLGYTSMGMDVSHKRKNWWGWGSIDASNWQGRSNGTFIYSVQENYNLYRTVNAPSSSNEQLRISVPSGTCSVNGNRLLNFTELYIDVTGNDGVRRSISHPFSTNF